MTMAPEAKYRTEQASRGEQDDGYAMGYSDIFMEMLMRRDAERNAAHLLPHLRPGMELLDLGCGPGGITAGLARAVYPGRVTGLDQNPQQLEMAEEHMARRGAGNVELVCGDALRMEFPRERFDAVHCHGFLMHSPAVQEQLAEIRRVLRPGGILASRDMDVAASFITPAALSHEIFGMLDQVVSLEQGDPMRGRRLKSLLVNAGFQEVRAGQSADCFDTRDEVEFLAAFLMDWALSPEFIRMTGHSAGELARWREQVTLWAQDPGAIGVFQFGHALGSNP